VYGMVPPLAVNGEKLAIAVVVVKFCAVVLAVAEIAGETEKFTVLVVLATALLASLTEKSTFAEVNVAVGVPDTTPVLVLKLIPVGNVPV